MISPNYVKIVSFLIDKEDKTDGFLGTDKDAVGIFNELKELLGKEYKTEIKGNQWLNIIIDDLYHAYLNLYLGKDYCFFEIIVTSRKNDYVGDAEDIEKFREWCNENIKFPGNPLFSTEIFTCFSTNKEIFNFLSEVRAASIFNESLVQMDNKNNYAIMPMKNVIEKDFDVFSMLLLRLCRNVSLINVYSHKIKRFWKSLERNQERVEGISNDMAKDLDSLDFKEKSIKELSGILERFSENLPKISSLSRALKEDRRSINVNIHNTKRLFKTLREKPYKEHPSISDFILNEETFVEQGFSQSVDMIDTVKDDLNTATNLIRGQIAVNQQKDSARMQKQGLVQQAALVVIEVVVVFYYSLNVWHLLVKESVWEHINPLGKLGVVFALAVAVLLFAHLLVEKKWNLAVIYLAVILIAIGCAYWITILSL